MSVLGHRMPQGSKRHEWPPGAYGPVMRDGVRVWCAVTPNGLHGDLSAHEVEEHEDGTITVSPSILVSRRTYQNRDDAEWHGYLRRGVWSEA